MASLLCPTEFPRGPMHTAGSSRDSYPCTASSLRAWRTSVCEYRATPSQPVTELASVPGPCLGECPFWAIREGRAELALWTETTPGPGVRHCQGRSRMAHFCTFRPPLSLPPRGPPVLCSTHGHNLQQLLSRITGSQKGRIPTKGSGPAWTAPQELC